MKKTILAGALAILGIAPAMAADMAIKAAPLAVPRPIYDWTGFYVGANGGWAQSNNCWDMKGALVFGFSPPLAEGCNNATGAVFGGQVGARYQVNNFVFGIEAQGDWADLKGSNVSTLPASVSAAFPGVGAALARFNAAGGTATLVNLTKVDAIGMFTGQVGYSLGSVLWYVKGGAAVTHNDYDGGLNIATKGFAFSATDHASAVRFGEVVGTGVDWMFAPNWTLGVEYNHLFMGSHDTGFALTSIASTPPLGVKAPLLAPGMPTRNDSISGDIDMVTARVGYKF